MKPLLKLCEETNQLTKEILKQISEQTRLFTELANLPRELQKSTQQLSHVLHMVWRESSLAIFYIVFLIILASQSITDTTR